MPPSERGHFKEYYSLRSQIGKGAYAVVFKCVRRSDDKVFAVKVVDKTKAGPKDIDDIKHEINVMEKVGYHPNVVQMIEYFSTERHLYLVLDMLAGGMLFDRIVQLKHYSEKDASELVRNFLSALAHIHSKGVIHRDLKPENLLLRYSEADSPSATSFLTEVCLADFGLAGYVPSTTCCGSPSYIAPEVINVGYFRKGKEYGTKCDIWSLGVITYILISGKMPFHGGNFKETFQCIVANRWAFEGPIWGKVSEEAKEFIKACLTYNPENRPDAKELMKHPWVTMETKTSLANVHLQDSLDGIKRISAQQKVRAAVRVFCWTQALLGKMDRTPPFMRYLRHEDKYSTIVFHQSQTDSKQEHQIDFGKALDYKKPGWKMQDCCTCASSMVCRHIQNVHEYLFVGSRNYDVYPFIDELRMMRLEAETDLQANPKDEDAKKREERIVHSIDAACVFSEMLGRVPTDQLKPNLMLDGSRNSTFREQGGSKSMGSWTDEERDAARKIQKTFKARQAAAKAKQPGDEKAAKK